MPPCDYSSYPENWKTEIVPAVRKRSGDRCEICNVANMEIIDRGFYNGVEVYQDMNGKIFATKDGEYLGQDYVGELDNISKHPITVVLTVSHQDHDITNNHMDNLKHLCQLHHLRKDIEQHKKTRRENKLKKQPTLF